MIIKSFSARKVHDFYDYNLKFQSDISFLVGDNGTGKTTALRLMQAALSIDVATLLEIKFSSLKVEVEKDGEEFVLSINTSPEKLLFRLNGEEVPYVLNSTFRTSGNRMVETISSNGRVTRHHVEDNRQDVIRSAGPLMQKFLRGSRPMFLGLERRLGKYQEDHFPEEVYMDDGSIRARVQRKEVLDGLDNCQRLVQSAYKQYRRASDGRLDRLLNIIVESTFEYIELEPGFLDNPNARAYSEMSDLQERRQELEKFARDLGGSEKATVLIEKFFEKMVDVAVNDNESGGAWSLEWLLNMAQIRRIQKVLAEMDRQKRSAERFYAPIKEFCDTINEFFRHSRKELTVDSLGKIKVTQNSTPVELEFLSSGEKQLLILIAHARFGSSKRSAFVVDEPEISLHMRWQEMLVDALLKGGKNNQFIFATHSPEIVGYHVDNCIRLG
ncbi:MULTISPECIES: AAA family ATPase [unclassified Pseudomonas]|uniref:AAA family ATPase n=1 Tax=unclassified Pseudomonas TaxID=196821 RepID=UPI001304DE5B|nr:MULTISPECIES: AAA family ATPase [unclassified Pseudomonas]